MRFTPEDISLLVGLVSAMLAIAKWSPAGDATRTYRSTAGPEHLTRWSQKTT